MVKTELNQQPQLTYYQEHNFDAVDVAINARLDPARFSNRTSDMSRGDIAILEMTLIAMAQLDVNTVCYVTSKEHANNELRQIQEGVIGLDTEFVKRVATGEEKIIEQLTSMGSPFKKAAKTAIQYLEAARPDFEVDWEHAGLCLVQIAHNRKVWVLNMTRMKAFPEELRRILTSQSIVKAGAGLPSDAVVLWEDARVDVKNMADVGLMTRLWRAESHQEDAFTFLALETAAKDVLGIDMDKTYQKGVDWKVDPHEAQITCRRQSLSSKTELKSYLDAALDAVVSLRLHEKLDPELQEANKDDAVTFSPSWYTFGSCMGEMMRQKNDVRSKAHTSSKGRAAHRNHVLKSKHSNKGTSTAFSHKLLPTRVKKPKRRRDSGTLTIAKIRRSPGSATSFERYVVGGTTSGEDGEGAESWLPGTSELVSGRNAAHLKLGFWVN
ncbi:ribonuclease H-like domain-containing protein [Mycena metata]|uniref:Ribonuclease H-like domain-containing protein n=1 Tax=Mycena metata TaxID=1033252 RepID=A0AAD7IM96_9AGAR|nr:ribonuclease H-like domain-containing protein [Mycena metata]